MGLSFDPGPLGPAPLKPTFEACVRVIEELA